MDWLLPVIGLSAATSATPGPNNFIVLAAASRDGVLGAAPKIVGVILGVIMLFTLTASGLALSAETPLLNQAVLWLGGAYLTWLGIGLLRSTGAPPAPKAERAFNGGAADLVGMTLFQFANPKAWVFAATVAAATPKDAGAIATAASALGLIALTSLLLWASAGARLADWLADPSRRQWFDRAMGAALIAFTILLLL